MVNKDIMNIDLQKLRKDRKFTQEEVAKMLWISRVAYNMMENDKLKYDNYINKLEEVFDVSFDNIQTKKYTVNKDTLTRSQELIIYILSKVWQLPNVGKTVLYKILYFIEFDYFELTGRRLTGLDFVKLPKWPAPSAFDYIINDMTSKNQIIQISTNYKWYPQQRYIPNEIMENLSRDGETKQIIDEVINRLKDMKAVEVSEYSHGDYPRIHTNDMQTIDINLVSSRQYPYSANARKERKEQAWKSLQMSSAFRDLENEEDLYEEYR